MQKKTAHSGSQLSELKYRNYIPPTGRNNERCVEKSKQKADVFKRYIYIQVK